MARIRTIKPEFFRHEAIQDLEADNPGNHVMLVFAALWGHCDSNGVFEYRPRQLKLDILPFLDFSMQTTLQLLVNAGFVVKYEAEGKTYGYIKSFCEHQRLTGKEASEGVKYPFNSSLISESQSNNRETVENQQDNSSETLGKHWGNTGEIPDAQEKEKEKEKEREGKGVIAAFAPVADATTPPAKPKRSNSQPKEYASKPDDVSDQVWREWLTVRNKKPTPLVITNNRTEAEKAGMTLEQALTYAVSKGWQTFDANWWANREKAIPVATVAPMQNYRPQQQPMSRQAQGIALLQGMKRAES